MKFYEKALSKLSNENLLKFIRDIEIRIGSHIIGHEKPSQDYIDEQKELARLALSYLGSNLNEEEELAAILLEIKQEKVEDHSY